MKRVIQLCTISIFLLLTSTMTHAANWEKIDSTHKADWFFDTDSIRYELKRDDLTNQDVPDTTKITYWEKAVIPDKALEDAKKNAHKTHKILATKYRLRIITLSLSNRTATVHESIQYTPYWIILFHDTKESSERIVPGTRREKMYNVIREYARTHHDQLIKNTYGN
ncbi:hypothetical protein [Selenomonas artemidis]|uniref:hypothetical protein n=1 Tax=Selenomonas artemidis TaxID=671224 RepID=UPI0023F27E5A|nr:hypothetical protein [Selenomonas artemidis]